MLNHPRRRRPAADVATAGTVAATTDVASADVSATGVAATDIAAARTIATATDIAAARAIAATADIAAARAIAAAADVAPPALSRPPPLPLRASPARLDGDDLPTELLTCPGCLFDFHAEPPPCALAA